MSPAVGPNLSQANYSAKPNLCKLLWGPSELSFPEHCKWPRVHHKYLHLFISRLFFDSFHRDPEDCLLAKNTRLQDWKQPGQIDCPSGVISASWQLTALDRNYYPVVWACHLTSYIGSNYLLNKVTNWQNHKKVIENGTNKLEFSENKPLRLPHSALRMPH